MEPIDSVWQILDRANFIPRMEKLRKKDEDYWNAFLHNLAHKFEPSQDVYEVASGERRIITVEFSNDTVYDLLSQSDNITVTVCKESPARVLN